MREMGARRLREAVQVLGRRRRNDPIPLGLRRELVAYARVRRRSGSGWGRIARELGVAGSTLQRWCTAVRGGAELRPVQVARSVERQRPAPQSALVVVTAAGHRVEGLSALEAAALLRALAG